MSMIQTVKWAWQRVVRGYDDRLFWSMDEYLDPIILAGIKNLQKNGHGYPNGITAKKWQTVLKKMIAGFSEEPEDLKSLTKYWKVRREALILFAFYYDDLWD